VPTQIPSIATFTWAPGTAPVNPAENPTRAMTYWLRRDIVRGVFAPAERLKVEHLATFYNIGHSPVREAILRLSSGGLIVHEYQKGYRVAPVSVADFSDAVDVYGRVYRMALSMAMERGDDAWEERVVVALHRSLKVQKVILRDAPERELWQQAYRDLHSALLSGCGSRLLLNIIGDIGDRLERYVNLFADLSRDRERDHHAEHREIVDALVARDLERLQKRIDQFFAVDVPMRESIVTALEHGASQPITGRATRARPAEPKRRATRKPRRKRAVHG
jgi:GntR family transcriptional regulator, carbon starvation induced regulator